jgi:hypothetical protein
MPATSSLEPLRRVYSTVKPNYCTCADIITIVDWLQVPLCSALSAVVWPAFCLTRGVCTMPVSSYSSSCAAYVCSQTQLLYMCRYNNHTVVDWLQVPICSALSAVVWPASGLTCGVCATLASVYTVQSNPITVHVPIDIITIVDWLHTGPYMQRFVSCCLASFRSDTWSLRNTGLQLFGALAPCIQYSQTQLLYMYL